ncbi:GNAT family N-acetyltransferase [Marivita hallyeonensis]|uniref:Acetyltransferase (GNAT) domain-containing protein n=1 Tax=Marivita hallyeonensis TaxID=996342 RepID=A0A1M5RLW1_9RHOB|nr:GNAT family N-acetyltransferase [Marivita hallyeonensis]SHH27191.1 Acetyltransferase (GNAT) domain-containing protein [Marivita hallyeonensis]
MPANPLPQSDAYANALRALGTRVLIDAPMQRDGTLARCLIQTRVLPFFGPVNLISRGPVGLHPDDSWAYLKDLDLKGPLIVNAGHATAPPSGHIRLAAPKRIALLSLANPDQMRAELHQKWRNALCKAERSSLTVQVQSFSPNAHRWLITHDRAQQKVRRYRSWPTRLLETFAQENPGQVRVVVARLGKTPVAAMLFLCHRPWATYHLGVTTPEGRSVAAHQLTLWHMVHWLAARGYTTLDLGLLTGPDSLDRFKLRSGATARTLGGTWLRLPKGLRRQFPSIHSPSGQKA